jgi:hypothetical protein
MSAEIVVHPKPAWRARANFLILGSISEPDDGSNLEWEQLWTKRLSSDRVEICCIPFFLYNLSLGDHVAIELDNEDRFVFTESVQSSGRFTFRAWFATEGAQPELEAKLTELGCLMERRWPGSRLLAIDAATEPLARMVSNVLLEYERSGVLTYETGRA